MTNEYLTVLPNTPPSNWSDKESIKTYKYELDYFQKWAVRAINSNENFMACVATGSGKSTLADYAIACCLANGKRVIFTSPIKALSNQKYKEFKEAYGEHNVGLMTGDIKFNPDAPCLIMTAEILRNLLYKHKSYTKDLGITSQLSLVDVDTVIMDEVHYINKRERGKVWEETIIMLPHEIKLVLLSATIDSPEVFADWVGTVRKRKINLVANTQRIIPLTHYLYKPVDYGELATDAGKRRALVPIMDNSGNWTPRVYRTWDTEYDRMTDFDLDPSSDEYKKQVDKSYGGKSRLNGLLDYLKLCGLCPAICFVFSRRKCEEYAKAVEQSLVSGKEAAEIENIFKFYTHAHTAELQSLPQYYTLLDTLRKGVAYHHSGLVPILKEVIEIIFAKGFIKMLFATETFAVGLNMPTKTVIFTEFRKPDGAEGTRMLYTDEYLQMAGRAGRRGLDTEGYVIYMPMRRPEREADVRQMMTGQKSAIKSKMDWGFDFIFKSLNSQVYPWQDIVVNSYWYRDLEKYLGELNRRVETLQEENAQIEAKFSADELGEMMVRHQLETEFKTGGGKKAQIALGNWKNSHISRKWDTLYTEYKRLEQNRVKLENAREEYQLNSDLDVFMGGYAHFLAEVGYLRDLPAKCIELNGSNLTERGVMASEINEGNPMLMTELYLWCCEHRDTVAESVDILCLLSLFLTGDRIKLEYEPCVSSDAVDFVRSKATELLETSDRFGLGVEPSQWEITLNWWDLVRDWVSGKSIGEVVETYDIYEGNIIRTMLKMSNLIEEWRNLAIYRSDVWMLERCAGIEELIIRDVVVPDSLYVRN